MSFRRLGFCGLFVFSAALVAEQGKLVLHVADVQGRPVAHVSIAPFGAGGGTQETDATGRVILLLAPETKANSLIQLQITRSPKGHDFVMFDPWREHPVRVPPFENDAMNFVSVVVADRGDRSMLENPRSLAAQITQANAPKTAGKQGAEDTSKESLEAISKQYGLAPAEIDKAIREWGTKATDPYDIGLAALYARNYPEATKQLTASLELREEVLKRDRKKDEDAVVEAASSLGQSLYRQGRYREAAVAQGRALQLRPDDPHLLNENGNSLLDSGDYAGAEPLYRRAVAITEKLFGPDHAGTAISLGNLAELLSKEGNYSGAEPLYRRALAICEKAFGTDDPVTATSLANLAQLLRREGNYAGAEPLFRRALAIDEQALGPEHPGTATVLNGLAEVLQDMGKNAGAEPLYRHALAIDEKALGMNHPETATSLNNLAGLLYVDGDFAGAESLYRRSLSIREKTLGMNHPDTAQSLSNLAMLLYKKEDYSGAEPLMRRALVIRESALGQKHPDTALSLNNLAMLLYKKGDYSSAEPLMRRALSIDESALGMKPSLDPVKSRTLSSDRGEAEVTGGIWERALEVAAGVKDPVAAAVFAAVLACGAFWMAMRNRDKRAVLMLGIVLGVGMVFLGALPMLAKVYETKNGIYAVRVVVLGVDGSPVEGAAVVCSPGGEEKSIAGGWECDVPPHNRPADGRFTAYATVKSAFLAGRGELRLANDYSPVLTIQLQLDRAATVQGEVQGKGGHILAGAWVSVVGHEAERAQTREDGGFTLAAHAANGQMVKLHVEAKGYPVYEGLQQAGDTSISIQLVP